MNTVPSYNYMKKNTIATNAPSNAYGLWLDFAVNAVLAFWTVPEKYSKVVNQIMRSEARSPFEYPHTCVFDGVKIRRDDNRLEFKLKVVFDKTEVKDVLERVYEENLDNFGEEGLPLMEVLKERTWNSHAVRVEKVKRRFLDTVRARFYAERAESNR